ncbi:MAG: DNA polymerase Y family protein [Microthrixaceae bacterium]
MTHLGTNEEAHGVRTVVLWCADWPVAVLADDSTQPSVVLSSGRVVSLDASARDMGVEVGMGRREAQRHCPHARVLDRDVDREARAFEVVVGALDSVVARLEVLVPGCCRFPARSAERYFGGEEALCDAVRDVAMGAVPAGCAVGVGVADGGFAAGLLARRSAERAATSGRGGACGAVARGASERFLAGLPVASLSGSPERDDLVGVLERLGVRTLGAFAALDAAAVAARFSVEGATAHRLARGLDPAPMSLGDPPEDFEVSHEPDEPLERVDRASFVAKSLADELHRRLAERGLATPVIVIEATTVEGVVLQRAWRHEGLLSSGAVAQRVRWQLDGWLTGGTGCPGRPGPLARLSVRPSNWWPIRDGNWAFGAVRTRSRYGPDAASPRCRVWWVPRR